MNVTLPKRVIANDELAKWRAAGWIEAGPAFTRGHSVVCWMKDSEPKEPGENEAGEVPHVD